MRSEATAELMRPTTAGYSTRGEARGVAVKSRSSVASRPCSRHVPQLRRRDLRTSSRRLDYARCVPRRDRKRRCPLPTMRCRARADRRTAAPRAVDRHRVRNDARTTSAMQKKMVNRGVARPRARHLQDGPRSSSSRPACWRSSSTAARRMCRDDQEYALGAGQLLGGAAGRGDESPRSWRRRREGHAVLPLQAAVHAPRAASCPRQDRRRAGANLQRPTISSTLRRRKNCAYTGQSWRRHATPFAGGGPEAAQRKFLGHGPADGPAAPRVASGDDGSEAGGVSASRRSRGSHSRDGAAAVPPRASPCARRRARCRCALNARGSTSRRSARPPQSYDAKRAAAPGHPTRRNGRRRRRRRCVETAPPPASGERLELRRRGAGGRRRRRRRAARGAASRSAPEPLVGRDLREREPPLRRHLEHAVEERGGGGRERRRQRGEAGADPRVEQLGALGLARQLVAEHHRARG